MTATAGNICADILLGPPSRMIVYKELPDGRLVLRFKQAWSDDYASHCTSFSLVDAIRCSFCPDA